MIGNEIMKKTTIVLLAIIFVIFFRFNNAEAQYLSVGIQGGYSLPVDSYFDGGLNYGIEFENFFNKYIGIGLGFYYTNWSQGDYDLAYMPLFAHFKFRIPFTEFGNGGRISMGGLIGAGIVFEKFSYERYFYDPYYPQDYEIKGENTNEEFGMTTGLNFEFKFNRFIGLVYSSRYTFVEDIDNAYIDFLLGFHFHFGKSADDSYDDFF